MLSTTLSSSFFTKVHSGANHLVVSSKSFLLLYLAIFNILPSPISKFESLLLLILH